MGGDRTAILVKFPAELLARVEAWASEKGFNRMAGILALVEDGLVGSEKIGSKVPAPRAPKKVLRAAEARVGVEPVVVVGDPRGASSAIEAVQRQVREGTGIPDRMRPRLDTSMVQVGPAPREYGVGAKGPKTTKGKR